jgi:hypothetical protein
MIFDLRSHFGVVGRPSSLHYPNTCLYQIPNTNPNRVGRVVSLIVKELDKFGYIEGKLAGIGKDNSAEIKFKPVAENFQRPENS